MSHVITSAFSGSGDRKHNDYLNLKVEIWGAHTQGGASEVSASAISRANAKLAKALELLQEAAEICMLDVCKNGGRDEGYTTHVEVVGAVA